MRVFRNLFLSKQNFCTVETRRVLLYQGKKFRPKAQEIVAVLSTSVKEQKKCFGCVGN